MCLSKLSFFFLKGNFFPHTTLRRGKYSLHLHASVVSEKLATAKWNSVCVWINCRSMNAGDKESVDTIQNFKIISVIGLIKCYSNTPVFLLAYQRKPWYAGYMRSLMKLTYNYFNSYGHVHIPIYLFFIRLPCKYRIYQNFALNAKSKGIIWSDLSSIQNGSYIKMYLANSATFAHWVTEFDKQSLLGCQDRGINHS